MPGKEVTAAAAAKRDAKADFEAQRKEVLDQVPEDYKKMFGRVGFARWGDAVIPALIVSPYDIPMGEGSPRETWLGMFNNVSDLSLSRSESFDSKQSTVVGAKECLTFALLFFLHSLSSTVDWQLWSTLYIGMEPDHRLITTVSSPNQLS